MEVCSWWNQLDGTRIVKAFQVKINSTRRRRSAGPKQRGLQKEQHQRKRHTLAHTHTRSELSLSRENRLCRKHFSAAAPAEIFNATTTATSARISAQERTKNPHPNPDQPRPDQPEPSSVPWLPATAARAVWERDFSIIPYISA